MQNVPSTARHSVHEMHAAGELRANTSDMLFIVTVRPNNIIEEDITNVAKHVSIVVCIIFVFIGIFFGVYYYYYVGFNFGFNDRGPDLQTWYNRN